MRRVWKFENEKLIAFIQPGQTPDRDTLMNVSRRYKIPAMMDRHHSDLCFVDVQIDETLSL